MRLHGVFLQYRRVILRGIFQRRPAFFGPYVAVTVVNVGSLEIPVGIPRG